MVVPHNDLVSLKFSVKIKNSNETTNQLHAPPPTPSASEKGAPNGVFPPGEVKH